MMNRYKSAELNLKNGQKTVSDYSLKKVKKCQYQISQQQEYKSSRTQEFQSNNNGFITTQEELAKHAQQYIHKLNNLNQKFTNFENIIQFKKETIKYLEKIENENQYLHNEAILLKNKIKIKQQTIIKLKDLLQNTKLDFDSIREQYRSKIKKLQQNVKLGIQSQKNYQQMQFQIGMYKHSIHLIQQEIKQIKEASTTIEYKYKEMEKQLALKNKLIKLQQQSYEKQIETLKFKVEELSIKVTQLNFRQKSIHSIFEKQISNIILLIKYPENSQNDNKIFTIQILAELVREIRKSKQEDTNKQKILKEKLKEHTSQLQHKILELQNRESNQNRENDKIKYLSEKLTKAMMQLKYVVKDLNELYIFMHKIKSESNLLFIQFKQKLINLSLEINDSIQNRSHYNLKFYQHNIKQQINKIFQQYRSENNNLRLFKYQQLDTLKISSDSSKKEFDKYIEPEYRSIPFEMNKEGMDDCQNGQDVSKQREIIIESLKRQRKWLYENVKK